MPYAIALEDSLCGAWHAFKRGQTVDNRKIENLLRMYKPPHITNTQQLQRLDIIDAPLMMQLAQAGLQTQTVPELAVLTRYKIVLSETSTTFPHINIYGDALGNHYAMTCQMGQQRHKALAHLSALLANATVTQTGLVTGVTSGTTYIRASSEGKTDSVPMLVRSLNAPTITAVSPVTWTPGAAATITGTNFAGDIASNIVQVNGVTATVTAASTTSISFIVPSATVLPCSPAGPIPITVSVAGDVTTGTANLAMATQRQLAVGESMLLSGAAEVGCNEFSATGGTYIVSAFNYATKFTPGN